jgi:hypothetical protein
MGPEPLPESFSRVYFVPVLSITPTAILRERFVLSISKFGAIPEESS